MRHLKPGQRYPDEETQPLAPLFCRAYSESNNSIDLPQFILRWGGWSSDGFSSRFAGTNPDYFIERGNKYFAVAHLAGLG